MDCKVIADKVGNDINELTENMVGWAEAGHLCEEHGSRGSCKDRDKAYKHSQNVLKRLKRNLQLFRGCGTDDIKIEL